MPGPSPLLRVMGVDPGSRTTGYAVVAVERPARGPRRVHYVECGVITAARAKLPQRLAEIARGLREVIADLTPDVAAVEDVFIAAHARAALKLGQARGVALLALAEAGLPVHEYPPARVKRAVTGNGRATKTQVQRMVRALAGLAHTPRADAADALAVALCHARAPSPALRGREVEPA